MQSRSIGSITALALILLLNSVTAWCQSTGKAPKPRIDDKIQLPYVRLYPSQLQVPKIHFRERVLLRADDATMETKSIASLGHAVRFRKPAGQWKLTGMIAYMGRKGHASSEEGIKMHVCDATGKSLSSVWRAKSKVRLGDPQWYMVDLIPTEVPEEFYVVVDLKRKVDDRSIVYLGSDTSDPTSAPEVVEPNTGEVYQLGQAGKWMIRAVLSGDGNRPEDLANAVIDPDQKLTESKRSGLLAYRAPDRKLTWVKQVPRLSENAGRIELSWDKKDAIVLIRYIGKRGSAIEAHCSSMTVDLPVSGKSIFEVSIMKPGYKPAVKQFSVIPGTVNNWKVELEAREPEEGITSI